MNNLIREKKRLRIFIFSRSSAQYLRKKNTLEEVAKKKVYVLFFASPAGVLIGLRKSHSAAAHIKYLSR